MFGVLMVTLLLTIALVGSNMDVILKQGIIYQVRSEITENSSIVESFDSVKEFEEFVQVQIDQRIKALGLDNPWYSPQRIGFTMYKILILDFGNATFLTSDSGSSNVGEILLEKIPRTVLPVSYTHLRAHETPEHLVCRLLLEKKKNNKQIQL